MKQCVRCGNQVDENVIKCDKCGGQKFNHIKEERQKKQAYNPSNRVRPARTKKEEPSNDNQMTPEMMQMMMQMMMEAEENKNKSFADKLKSEDELGMTPIKWVLTMLIMIVPILNIIYPILKIKNNDKRTQFFIGYLIYYLVAMIISIIISLII